MEKVEKTPTCWLWTAYIKPNGYGQFGLDKVRRGYYAHRFSYEHFVGPIPDGFTIDHLCLNPACVNPDHLECVTQRENVRRGNGFPGRLARATHCIHGHEFSSENTKILNEERGWRECRQCRKGAYQRSLVRVIRK